MKGQVIFNIEVSDDEIEGNAEGKTKEEIIWTKFYYTTAFLLGGDLRQQATIQIEDK